MLHPSIHTGCTRSNTAWILTYGHCFTVVCFSPSIFITRPRVIIDMISLDKLSMLAKLSTIRKYQVVFSTLFSAHQRHNLIQPPPPPHHYWYNLCKGKNKITLLICVGRQSGSTVFAPGNDLKHKRRPSVKPSTWQHMKNRQISTKVSSLSLSPACRCKKGTETDDEEQEEISARSWSS